MQIEIESKYPDYFYRYYSIKNKKLLVNASSIQIDVKPLADFFNSLPQEYLIIVARTDKDCYSENYPTPADLNLLIELVSKKSFVYYQEPWPASIPLFSTDSNAVVLKFGYDEDCPVDKAIASGKDIEINTKHSSVLLHNKNVIELENSSNLHIL